MLNWEKIKSEVDIEAYFLHKMGHKFTFDKYKRAYVQRNPDGSVGDIIRFFNHRISGIKIYYSIFHQDSGDIIQFIRRRILRDDQASYEKINEELRQYLGTTATYENPTETISRKNNIKSSAKFQVDGNIIRNIEDHLDYLHNYRKLSKDTINAEEFNGMFFDYESGSIHTLSFYLKDIHGDICGINRIQTTDNEYFNKKWFAPKSNNSEGFAWSRAGDNTETLSVFESIFDAMSYFEIYSPRNTQFVATNGELSFRKASLLVNYFNNKGLKKWLLCNDADLSGQYFNLNIVGNIIPFFQNIKRSASYIKMDIVSENNHPKLKLLLRFFKPGEKSIDFKANEQSSHYYFQEMVSDSSVKTSLLIPSTTKSVQFFVGLLLDIFDLTESVTVKVPTNKDFNEDLIQKKLCHGEKRPE